MQFMLSLSQLNTLLIACVYIQDAIILIVCAMGTAETIGMKQLAETKYNLYISLK